jgi:S-adenosylmethionine hydrolase
MTDVSDGCLYHVCLRVDTATVLAANPEKQYKLISRTVALHGKDGFAQACEAEMQEGKRLEAAEKSIQDLVKIGIRTLLAGQKLPQMIDAEDDLEIRLLLCRRETVTA